jgi:hypothetical protein
MKRVESVWAALSQQKKVDLSNTTEIKALVNQVEGFLDASDNIFREYAGLVDEFNAVGRRIKDLAGEAEMVGGEMTSAGMDLYRAEEDMIKAAAALGVDKAMVVDILRDLNIDVEVLLGLADKASGLMAEVAGRYSAIPELK